MVTSKDKTVIHSIEKAVNILKLFSKQQPLLTLGEISEKTGFTKTTVLRYCKSLEKLNFIEKTYEGTTPYYRLGMELFVIGSQALHAIDLPSRAKPYLKKMVEYVGENAYLFIERNDRAYCVEKQTGNNIIQVVTTHIGDSLPLNVGGGPSAIFTSMDSIRQKEVLAGYRLTEEENENIYEKLEFFKRNKYVISINETYNGTVAIGAPVYNHEGVTVGALSIGGIESRITEEKIPKIASTVKDLANKLSAELGWTNV